MTLSLDESRQLALADHYLSLGLRAAARAVLVRHFKSSTAVDVHVRLAQLELRSGHCERALYHAEELARRIGTIAESERPAVVSMVAKIAQAAGAHERAKEAYRSLSGEPRRSLEAAVGLARICHEAGQNEAALQHLEAAMAVVAGGPARDVEDLCKVASACGCAEALLNALQQQPERNGYETLALALLGSETGASRAQVERWLSEAAELPLARFLLALRLARRRGADPEARQRAESLLEQLMDGATNESVGAKVAEDVSGGGGGALTDEALATAEIALLLASIRDDAGGDVSSAGDLYREALRGSPTEALGYNNLGVVALHEGDMVGAAEFFGRVIGLDADYQLAFQNLARVLAACGSPDQLATLLHRSRQFGLTWDALPKLLFAVAEVAREEVQHGLASRGHQFKNLLGVLGTRARSLLRRLPADQRQGAHDLVGRLSAAYDDWAAFLRTVREDVGTLEAADINRLIHEAVTISGAEVELDLEAQRIHIGAMPGQLREALVNVIRNGAEAQGGQGQLRVRSRRSKDGRQVVVSVRDQGMGIPAADLRRLFVPGFTTKQGGSGLGLGIVERVLRSHGGRVEIESTVGKGTEVRLILPVLLESQLRHGMLRAPIAKIAGAARAQELVSER
jgi:signal transduction histidine kinase